MNLSPKQQEILDWLAAWFADHDYAPSYRQIAEAMGVGNGTVQHHLNQLRRAGRVDWNGRQPRTLRLIYGTDDVGTGEP